MSVPAGFFELSPLPGSLGPLAAKRPAGIEDPTYPVLVRMRLYWGKPGEPAPANVQGYPASVLYGGPVPRQWGMNILPAWVRDWAATLAPPAGASSDGSRWLVLLGPPAFLVPPEALAFPFSDFRWLWMLEQGPGDLYQVEGAPGQLQFRNLTTGSFDRPGAFGSGPTSVAGDELGGCTCPLNADVKAQKNDPELTADSDEIDPRAITWLTEEDWVNNGSGIWPVWITNEYSVGAAERCPVGFDAGGGHWVQCECQRGHEGHHVAEGSAWEHESWDPSSSSTLERLWAENRLTESNKIQCGATTHRIDGVITECSLRARHPGPHMNGPPRLGRIWPAEPLCDACLFDPSIRISWPCQQVAGHAGMHTGYGHAWANRTEDEVGAAKAPIDWYRIHYLDVLTQNETWSPWPQRMTLAQAKAWVKKRTTYGSTVLALLQKFISGKGWRTV